MIRDFEGFQPQLGEGAWVDPQALVLGQVTLGADVSIWPMAVVRGDVNSITIGARSNIQDNSTLHVTHDGPYTPGGVPLVRSTPAHAAGASTPHAARMLVGMSMLLTGTSHRAGTRRAGQRSTMGVRTPPS